MHEAQDARTGFHCALIAGAVLLTWTETRSYDIDGAPAWILAALLNWSILLLCSLVLFALTPLAVAARERLHRLAARIH